MNRENSQEQIQPEDVRPKLDALEEKFVSANQRGKRKEADVIKQEAKEYFDEQELAAEAEELNKKIHQKES